MIMSGKKDAVLHQVNLIDIHGTRFYDITFSHTDTPDQPRRARIGVEDAYPDPTTRRCHQRHLSDECSDRHCATVIKR
jgi:hypothetical protein